MTNAIYEECGSDWSHQVAMATTQQSQCDQIIPLSVKGVACKSNVLRLMHTLVTKQEGHGSILS